MKKLFALLMVCGFAFAFVACGGKKAEEATTEPAATEETAPATEEAPADSTAADSTAAQ
ncbi:hypothetical protein QQ054_12015 [Oscillatoria amoena NRMC-F 0135]|nr:hypothetical protein [Oscillatoria amoena NRMC-F 0135]